MPFTVYKGSTKHLFLGHLWFNNLWTILQLLDPVRGCEDTVKSWMHFNVSWSVCIHTVWPSVSNNLVKLFVGKVSKIVLKILSVFLPRYDNEYGYSHRVVDLIKYLAGKEWTPCSRPIVIQIPQPTVLTLVQFAPFSFLIMILKIKWKFL